jgi:multiple sugar transport system substrate-binding protein
MKNKIKFISAFFIIILLMSLSGCTTAKNTYLVDLEIWGVFDSNDAFNQIFKQYTDSNPFIRSIRYKKIAEEDYKKEVLDALASGNGPDIFMIQNNWLPAYEDKTVEAPVSILNEQQFRNNFVDVAANDFVDEGKVYAVPLSVDSLALYYNRDLLNAEGITTPPTNWDEFKADVKKLTKVDSYGNIIQSGAALGTAYNINRSTDILGLLMFQQGANIVENRRNAAFNRSVTREGKLYSAGENAWKFYTDFAKSGTSVYSWNPDMHYSIDSFYEGKTAMMLNYSWHYQTIKNKNPKMNFGVALVPQDPEGITANYANYWGFAVAKNKVPKIPSGSKVPVSNDVRVSECWEFLKAFTTKNNGTLTLTNFMSKNTKDVAFNYDPAKIYIEKTIKPSARRDIIEEQKNDVILGPFAYGNLIAKSWYQIDPDASELILAEAIDSINKGSSALEQAINLAANRITQLMR